MFRAQISVPSSPSSLTHEVEWYASAPGPTVCGLPGRSPGRQVAFQEGDRGLASWPFCKQSHSVQCCVPWVWSRPLPPFSHCKGKGWNLGGFLVSWCSFLIVSVLGQELLAHFHWILNFKFENKIQRAFTRPFLNTWMLSSCICVCFIIYIFVFESPNKCQPLIRRAGIIICIFHMEKPALKGEALARSPAVLSSGFSALLSLQHNPRVPVTAQGFSLMLGVFSHFCEILKPFFSLTSNVDHLTKYAYSTRNYK